MAVSLDLKREQISKKLEEKYFPIVPQLPNNQTPAWHYKNRLSRSLAAFAIEKLAEVDVVLAAGALIDGGDDNGIDAVYFDQIKNRLFVVQSKAGDAPDAAANGRFCRGIDDLMEGKFQNFNAAFARLLPSVEIALNRDGVIVVACQVHRGYQGLAQHAVRELNELAIRLNVPTIRMEWHEYGIAEVHSWLTAEHVQPQVDVRITLTHWQSILQPRRAIYGLISSTDLAGLYNAHGKSLFEKNIRYYLGAEDVNEAIQHTVQTEPLEFFYLNNGITATCKTLAFPPKRPINSITFQVTGLSIVNGAQTVGSIASALGPDLANLINDAKVLFTLIEVGDSADGIGKRITRARNTQNQIKYLYFVALDPNQERLRQEMAISKVVYQYRPSEDEGDVDVLRIENAMLALAGLQGDTRIVVTAKKQVGQLYDIDGEYYRLLFKPELTGALLIRKIRLFEYLNGIFDSQERTAPASSRRRMFFRHGRLFILHIFARRYSQIINKAEMELSEEDQLNLSDIILEIAERIFSLGEDTFLGIKGYLAVFNNQTDSIPFATQVMETIGN